MTGITLRTRLGILAALALTTTALLFWRGADQAAEVWSARLSAAGAPPLCATDLTDALEDLGAPGLAAAIVTPQGVACASAAGYADLETRRAVTIDTLFLTASVSKTVTAAAVMQLFEDGAFALEDDVSAHLPFRLRAPSAPKTPITFRQLLTHTAAIRDDSRLLGRLETDGADSPLSLGAFIRGYFASDGIYYSKSRNFWRRAPGARSSYSNMGVVLLGFLAERISGRPFDALTRDRILAPLRMDNSAWRLARLDRSNLATPYEMRWYGPVAYDHSGQPNYPDGMLRASARDLGRFLAAMVGNGRLGDARILAPETVDLMLSPQPDAPRNQGLIWFTEMLGGRRVWGHDGSDDGASAWIWLDRTKQVGVLILANSDVDDDEARALGVDLFDEAERFQ